jgi:hypothetical protein
VRDVAAEDDEKHADDSNDDSSDSEIVPAPGDTLAERLCKIA